MGTSHMVRVSHARYKSHIQGTSHTSRVRVTHPGVGVGNTPNIQGMRSAQNPTGWRPYAVFPPPSSVDKGLAPVGLCNTESVLGILGSTSLTSRFVLANRPCLRGCQGHPGRPPRTQWSRGVLTQKPVRIDHVA